MLDAFLQALPAVFQLENIAAIVFGTLIGMVAGSLPGLTATMTIAILIPLTFGLQPLVALGMMAGIYNGAMYGGAIPAILLRIPGTPPAIVTTFDGYPMAQKGEAAYALKVACWSSAIGSTLSAIALMTIAPQLVKVTLLFGPAEYFWVAVFGLSCIAVLLGRDPVKGFLAACIGLLLSMVGIDTVTGHERFTFDNRYLLDGLELLVVLTGLYAVPPAVMMAEAAVRKGMGKEALALPPGRPIWREAPRYVSTWIRGSVIGIIVGILPGTGGSMAAFISYNETRRASREPETFGQGNPLGVAAAETGNSADNAASLIPALTLGIPGSGVAAVIMSGMLVHGLQPGPQLFRDNGEIVYGFMIQMLLTSLLLFAFGGAFASRVFSQVLRVPPVILAPLILALAVVGIYTLNNSMFEVYLMLGFGLLGYTLDRLGLPLAPVILGLLLGNLAEQNFRLALLISNGDWTTFFASVVSWVVVGLTALILLYPALRAVLAGRRAATS